MASDVAWGVVLRRVRGGVIACGVTAGVLLGGMSAAQTAPMWAIATSPNQGGAVATGLSDVSCGSAVSCVAVGSSSASDPNKQWPFEARWNGQVWSKMPRVLGVYTVSCVTATSCFGAGSAGSGPKIAHWNGTAWANMKVPNPAIKSGFAGLDDISCTSASRCVAVGYLYDSPTPPGYANRTFALVWNGRTWTLAKTPNPAGTKGIDFWSVACSNSTSCVAVGDYSTVSRSSSLNRSFAARWNGKTWSLTTMPAIPAGAATTRLTGVSCVTPAFCLATGQWVGKYGGPFGGLVERWNGQKWSAVTAADADGFDDVSCTSTTNCVLTGYSTPPEHPAIEHWDGSTVSAITIPLPNDTSTDGGANGYSSLVAIACRSAGMCVAVGSDTPPDFSNSPPFNPPANTLIEQLG
jgi:hypothetical protein